MPEPSDLFAMLIFSIIGLLAFRTGKRESEPPKLIIGLLLMLYPYCIPSGFWLWATGILLTAGLFFFKQ